MKRSFSGLALMQSEMAREHHDALASLEAARDVALEIAGAARATKNLNLFGMGASHAANRVAEVEYRRLGLETHAVVLSEALYSPLPDAPRTVIVASQSGASAEVVKYLETPARSERRFGLTLDPDSPLARGLPSLIGSGGVEVGFAATRSFAVSLALHAAVLEALGEPQEGLRAILGDPPKPDIQAALETLRGSDCVILSGRSSLQGLAETIALNIVELARIPALALEGGQFRHGPLEILRPSVGVILLRASGVTATLTESAARACLDAGVVPVVFDVSGLAPIDGATTVRFPGLSGIAAATAILWPIQNLLLEFCATKVERVGEPVRSNKVTREG